MYRTILLLLKDLTTPSISCILVPMLGLLLSVPGLKDSGIAAIPCSSDVDRDQIVDARDLVVLADRLAENILIASVPEETDDVSIAGRVDFVDQVRKLATCFLTRSPDNSPNAELTSLTAGKASLVTVYDPPSG